GPPAPAASRPSQAARSVVSTDLTKKDLRNDSQLDEMDRDARPADRDGRHRVSPENHRRARAGTDSPRGRTRRRTGSDRFRSRRRRTDPRRRGASDVVADARRRDPPGARPQPRYRSPATKSANLRLFDWRVAGRL